MKTIARYFFVFFVFASIMVHSQSMENDVTRLPYFSLKGTHSIYVQGGILLNSNTSTDVTVTEVDVETNIVGFFGYQYWFDEEWSVTAKVGFLSAGTNVQVTSVSSISVLPMLMGFNYYPKAIAIRNIARPFFGVNAGIYTAIGTKSNLNLLNFSGTAINETVFGVEANAGMDFFISNWIRIGPVVSYHAAGDFKEVIGSKSNYSGFACAVNIGVLL